MKTSRLKKELQARNDEIAELRKDYRKGLEKVEKLNIEIDTLRATAKLGGQQNREFERINDLNRTMSIEVETLRKSVRGY